MCVLNLFLAGFVSANCFTHFREITSLIQSDETLQPRTIDDFILASKNLHTPEKLSFPNERVEAVIAAAPSDEFILKNFGKKYTKNGMLLRHDERSQLSVYYYPGLAFKLDKKKKEESDELLKYLGILRERNYRAHQEGSGLAYDIDKYDERYGHFLVVDEKTKKIIGAYRGAKLADLLTHKGHIANVNLGLRNIYTASFFDQREFLREYGFKSMELGRSFVDLVQADGRLALRALKIVWEGISKYLTINPNIRYLTGSLSISNKYSTTSQIIMLGYLSKSSNEKFDQLVRAKSPLKFDHPHFEALFKLGREIESTKDLNLVVQSLDGYDIPSLIISYQKLGATYNACTRDLDFGSIDCFLIVDLLSLKGREEIKNKFGDNWEAYLIHQSESLP